MWIALKRNCNFHRVLQNKWGSVETETGVRAGVDVNIFEMYCKFIHDLAPTLVF